MRPLKIALAASSLILGSLLALLPSQNALRFARQPSATEDEQESTRNDYSRLPCADEAAMKQYMKKLKVKTPPHGKLCGEGSDYEKLGKLLRFMEETRFSETAIPGYGGFKSAQAPIDYISRLVNSVNFEGFESGAAAENVVAFNRADDVFVGPMLLALPPIDGASVMIHEAFHSDKSDAGHAGCSAGELAGQEGACDAMYSARLGMGAYSISTHYYLAVAFGGLEFSESDKTYAYSRAIALLDNRFNALPSDQAVLENLVLLDDQGGLRVLHPIALTLMDRLQFHPELDENDLAVRMLESTEGKLCVSTRSGKLRCGRNVYAYVDPLKDIQDSDKLRVRDFRRLAADNPALYVLDERNQLSVVHDDPLTGKGVLKDSSYQPNLPIRQLLSVDGFMRMALGMSGEIYPFGDMPRSFTNKTLVSDPQKKGWGDASGGFLSSDIFTIQNETGDFYQWSRGNQNFEMSKMQCPSGALQYAEAALTRVLLCQDSSLHVRRYRDERVSQWTPWIEVGSQFVGVGVVPRFHPGKEFLRVNTERRKEFAKLCGVKNPQPDPWTDGFIGVDDEGQLVLTGKYEMTCRLSLNPKTNLKPIKELSFSSGESRSYPREFSPYGADLKFVDGSSARVETYD